MTMKNGVLLGIDTRQQWSNYWHQGHLTSLPCGFSSNYDGEFLNFWRQQFTLLGPGDRVLDVCSGNGAIALLAQDYADSNKVPLNITAVDAADIDVKALSNSNPDIARRIQGITFKPNTLLEEISEEATSFNLITSQYGIEYTDWEISAAKIYDLLKPGGYFSMICHSIDSKIINQMTLQQRDYAQLLELPIFSRGLEFESGPAYPKKFIKQLDQALDAIYAIFKQDRTSDVLSEVGRQLEQIQQLALKDFNAAFQGFTQFRQALIISYSTSTDLLSVNNRLQQVPDWYNVFSEAGLKLLKSGDIYYHTRERAGKYYQFRKTVQMESARE